MASTRVNCFSSTLSATCCMLAKRPDIGQHAHDALQRTQLLHLPQLIAEVLQRETVAGESLLARNLRTSSCRASPRPVRSATGCRPCQECGRPCGRDGRARSRRTFRPTPMNLIGWPVTSRIESAAPPRASPSILVSTTPVRASFLWNSSAECTASCPVMASATNSISCGFRSFFSICISSINCSSMCRRPAVSTISMSQPLMTASRRASFASRSPLPVLRLARPSPS